MLARYIQRHQILRVGEVPPLFQVNIIYPFDYGTSFGRVRRNLPLLVSL
jgi:hypothetical protein